MKSLFKSRKGDIEIENVVLITLFIIALAVIIWFIFSANTDLGALKDPLKNAADIVP